jgi:uncharacterized membrane protein
MLTRFADNFQRHWLRYIVGLLIVYSSLPVLAPVLKAAGFDGAAQAIYFPYKGLCHTYGFRSFYLFGEKAVYSRPEFEAKTGIDTGSGLGLFAARDFQGNAQMGYKLATCQRDIAIYPSIALGGIIFGLLRKRPRMMPWWLFLILGILPIGLDGFSQLFSQPPLNLITYRESNWVLRVVTGGLFGFSIAWLVFPLMAGTIDPIISAQSNDSRRA